MIRTNKDLRVEDLWPKYGYTDLIIPKGTRTTHMTACGYDETYNFINDLSWIPEEHSFFRHDMTYYGINLPLEHLEAICSRCGKVIQEYKHEDQKPVCILCD